MATSQGRLRGRSDLRATKSFLWLVASAAHSPAFSRDDPRRSGRRASMPWGTPLARARIALGSVLPGELRGKLGMCTAARALPPVFFPKGSGEAQERDRAGAKA